MPWKEKRRLLFVEKQNKRKKQNQISDFVTRNFTSNIDAPQDPPAENPEHAKKEQAGDNQKGKESGGEGEAKGDTATTDSALETKPEASQQKPQELTPPDE